MVVRDSRYAATQPTNSRNRPGTQLRTGYAESKIITRFPPERGTAGAIASSPIEAVIEGSLKEPFGRRVTADRSTARVHYPAASGRTGVANVPVMLHPTDLLDARA